MPVVLSKEDIQARIAKCNTMTPLEREQEKCRAYNSQPGSLWDPGEYDCKLCLNRDHFMRIRPDGTRYMEDCSCKPIRLSILSAKNAGIYQRLLRCDFKSFQVSQEWEARMKDTALRWAKEGQDQWLLLCGQSGSGKTHLTLAAVGYRIFHRNQRVCFLDWRNFNTARECDKARFQELLDRAMEAQILFIDDLLKLDRDRSFHPSAEKELAFQIINHRANLGRITVISTELTDRELLNMDEATGSRILHLASPYSFAVGRDSKKNRRLRGMGRLAVDSWQLRVDS